MKNKKFIVKEEAKKVIAMMKDIPRGIVEESYDRGKKLTGMVVHLIALEKDVDIFNSSNPLFKAYATCDEKDTFDEYTGKEIAASLVDKKYHLAMAKRYSRVIKYLNEIETDLSVLAQEHIIKANNITEDLKRCYGTRED